MFTYNPHQKSHNSHSPNHLHYHYHYHYPTAPSEQLRTISRSQHLSPTSRTYRASSQNHLEQTYNPSQLNEWKRYLNPKVSRMYDEYRLEQSRFSQKNHRISQQDENVQITSPRKSDVMHQARYSLRQSQKKHHLSKQDELYYLNQNASSKILENDGSKLTTRTNTSSIATTDKLAPYLSQIERLRSIQQECIYLRQKFYLHVASRHPQELK